MGSYSSTFQHSVFGIFFAQCSRLTPICQQVSSSGGHSASHCRSGSLLYDNSGLGLHARTWYTPACVNCTLPHFNARYPASSTVHLSVPLKSFSLFRIWFFGYFVDLSTSSNFTLRHAVFSLIALNSNRSPISQHCIEHSRCRGGGEAFDLCCVPSSPVFILFLR